MWAYVAQEESHGRDVEEDLCIVISVEMHSYMVRCYGIAVFQIRGVPVIAENMCPSVSIRFLSRRDYEEVRGDAEYWQ